MCRQGPPKPTKRKRCIWWWSSGSLVPADDSANDRVIRALALPILVLRFWLREAQARAHHVQGTAAPWPGWASPLRQRAPEAATSIRYGSGRGLMHLRQQSFEVGLCA